MNHDASGTLVSASGDVEASNVFQGHWCGSGSSQSHHSHLSPHPVCSVASLTVVTLPFAYCSRKGKELLDSGRVAFTVYWEKLQRAVRLEDQMLISLCCPVKAI